MLSFAKDESHDGHFEPFSKWGRQGITKPNIEQDVRNHPDRKYLVSLGGAAAYGGTFSIQSGMSTEDWVSNAVTSVSTIINSLSAVGAEMQFEGGCQDPRFQAAMTGLLHGLKGKGYITAIGPYYGGTWPQYKELPMGDVDFVNLQLYAMDAKTVSAVMKMISSAQADLGGDASKLVAGFNSAGRNPSPSVSLQTVYEMRNTIWGVFTWDIKDSVHMRPAFCLEDNFNKILNQNEVPGPCAWKSEFCK